MRKTGKEYSQINRQISDSRFKSKLNVMTNPIGGNKSRKVGGMQFAVGGKAIRGGMSRGRVVNAKGKKVGSVSNSLNTLRAKLMNSGIGKAIRGIKDTINKVVNVAKKVYSTIKKAIKLVYKVTKTLVKATYKTAKFAVKTFYKASKFVGGMIRGGLRYATKVAKDIIANGPNAKIRYSSPAKVITRIGWRLVKFIGKKLWQGIKKLALAGLALLKKMFDVGKRFVNKVSTYILKLGVGITSATYKFLLEPIANMMVSIFGFMMDVVKTHVNFAKQFIPDLLDRMSSTASMVKRKAKQVLKSTWGVFKKILFNPITIILLVGGLFLFFGPKLIEWLTGLVGGIRDTLIPVLSKYAKKAIEILTPIWNCLCFIGKILFRVVKWLTDPDNFIVKAITAIIKMVLMFKGFLKKMMKVAGKSSIDILCMFLAGDTIGIALHTAIGLLKTIWNYVQKKGIIRKIKNLFKQFPKLYLMIWAIPGTFLASIANASWAFLKWLGSKVGIGDDKAVSSVADAFCKPWKLWWSVIENIMNDGDAPEIPKDQFLTVDPITQTEGIKSETKISVKKLGMVGTNASIVMGKMDELTKMSGFNTDKTMLKRIKGMESLYEYNTIQVMEFDKFLSGIAEMSKKNDENSERLLSMLLEDPDLSQKILSVFFYYNPQTQETQMLRPMQFIGQFVKNLQGLMSPSNSDSWGKRLELLVDALD